MTVYTGVNRFLERPKVKNLGIIWGKLEFLEYTWGKQFLRKGNRWSSFSFIRVTKLTH